MDYHPKRHFYTSFIETLTFIPYISSYKLFWLNLKVERTGGEKKIMDVQIDRQMNMTTLFYSMLNYTLNNPLQVCLNELPVPILNLKRSQKYFIFPYLLKNNSLSMP